MTAMSAEAPTNAEPAPAELATENAPARVSFHDAQPHVLLVLQGDQRTYENRHQLRAWGLTWVREEHRWVGILPATRAWYLTAQLGLQVVGRPVAVTPVREGETLAGEDPQEEAPVPPGAPAPQGPAGPEGPARSPTIELPSTALAGDPVLVLPTPAPPTSLSFLLRVQGRLPPGRRGGRDRPSLLHPRRDYQRSPRR